MELPEGQELPSGTYRNLLQEKYASEIEVTDPKPATTFQLIMLAEKMGRKYSTGFEARMFKAKVQCMLARRVA